MNTRKADPNDIGVRLALWADLYVGSENTPEDAAQLFRIGAEEIRRLTDKLATVLAAERERCAQWHDEQENVAWKKAEERRAVPDFGGYEAWRTCSETHQQSARAIRAMGDGNG